MTGIYDRINERFELKILDNGLKVCYIPKEGFSKTFAVLATNYGSCDQSFSLDGKRYDTPAGVAHFLEHKMFEDKDGNALQKFAKTGASPNAFTSQVMTGYHFSCTDRFKENLEILLKFVFTPYFTEENVKKERGIIAQEIGMINDTPAWRVFTGVYEGLYKDHPVRVPIAGSVESIAEITPEVLYACHRAFYSPNNMVLVVCGTADFAEVCGLAEKHSPKEKMEIGERHYGSYTSKVCADTVTQTMSVSKPQFLLGFKDDKAKADESHLKKTVTGDIAVKVLCGETSPLYAEMYDKRLISRDFETDYKVIPEGAQAIFGGESGDPETVRQMIESEALRLAKGGVDEKLFERVKKSVYGLYLRSIESPEGCARNEASSLFWNEHYADFAMYIDAISSEDIQKLYSIWTERERSTLSVVKS